MAAGNFTNSPPPPLIYFTAKLLSATEQCRVELPLRMPHEAFNIGGEGKLNRR
jgi:hypothetical protein